MLSSRPLHVGLIYWDPFTPGGVQSQVAGRLDHLGYPDGPVRYTLFSKQPPPDPHPWPHIQTIVFSGWDRFSIAFSEYTASRALVRELDRVHREDPFDLIDLHAGGAGPQMRPWSTRSGVPYLFCSHSARFASGHLGLRWEVVKYYTWANRQAALGAKRVIAVSQALKDEWGALGISTDKIDVLHTATSAFRPLPTGSKKHPDTFELLFVGRDTPEKGLDLLIAAVERCQQHVDNALRLTVIGEVSESHALRQQVRERELPVDFLGILPNHDVRQRMSESDLLVIPSRYDACPVVAIEGLSVGALILGTRVGGLKELISDDETGILVPPDDGEAIADAIAHVMHEPASANRLRLAALEAGKKNLWDYRARQIAASYRSEIADGAP